MKGQKQIKQQIARASEADTIIGKIIIFKCGIYVTTKTTNFKMTW